MSEPIEIVIAYSLSEEQACEQVRDFLSASALRQPIQNGQVKLWYRKQIIAGGAFTQIIREHLAAAKVIILLISQSFLTDCLLPGDDYNNPLAGVEIEDLVVQHKQKKIRLIPVIIRYTDISSYTLKEINLLPDNGKRVYRSNERDEALTNVTIGVYSVVQDLIKESTQNKTNSGTPILSLKSTQNKDEKSPIDFVIITALQEELRALLTILPYPKLLEPSMKDIRAYYHVELPVTRQSGRVHSYNIILLSSIGMGRLEANNAAHDAINRWHPSKILLVGIAGGIGSAGVKCGDILIADQIVDYELQKLGPTPSQPRWKTSSTDPRLLEAAKHLLDNWRTRLQQMPPEPVIPQKHIGPIATGDKVIAHERIQSDLLSAWPKLIGFEMESGGVATAAFQSANQPGFFMIRGVSDLANVAKNDDWHSYACHVAATFTLALLESGPIPFPEDS